MTIVAVLPALLEQCITWTRIGLIGSCSIQLQSPGISPIEASDPIAGLSFLSILMDSVLLAREIQRAESTAYLAASKLHGHWLPRARLLTGKHAMIHNGFAFQGYVFALQSGIANICLNKYQSTLTVNNMNCNSLHWYTESHSFWTQCVDMTPGCF